MRHKNIRFNISAGLCGAPVPFAISQTNILQKEKTLYSLIKFLCA
jgi:hypothetical protein